MRGWLDKRSVLRLLAAWLLAAVCAGALAAAPRTLRFERLSVQSGLSQETVLTILQDRQGFMWFGTQAGLTRYDGYRTTVFRNVPGDPSSLADNYVNASFEDGQGRLWFGTKGGLARFDLATQSFVSYAAEPARRDAANRSVNAIVPDRRGGLWLATGDGVKHFDPASGRFTSLRHDARDPASLADDAVNALALDDSGALWAGTGAGLDRLAPGAHGFEHFAPGAGDARRNAVLSLAMGPRSTLYVGTGAGLQAWHLGDGAPVPRRIGAAEGLGDVRILSLYLDGGPNLWVGTDGDGLKWLDPATGHFVSYRNQPFDLHSLADNQVVSVWVDRTGTLWAGTQFGGVSRTDLASGGFARYIYTPGQEGLGNGKVRAIAANGDGRIWLGTLGGGLSLFDPATGTGTQLRHDPARPGSLPDDSVPSLAVVGQRLWVGSASGLSWRDRAGGSFHQVALGVGGAATYVMALLPGRDGTLWVATRGGGLYALGADGRLLRRWQHDPREPASLGDNTVIALLEDSHGTLWAGTDNGLDRLDRASGKFIHYRRDPRDASSLRHNRIYHLFESSRGQLWVGTAGGLHLLEHGADGKVSFKVFPVVESNDAVPIGAVLEDSRGTLWVSTTLGISRLDPATGQYKSYSAKDGLVDGSYFVGSALRAPDGQMHFGGVGGLTSFMPDAIRDNPYPPAVEITGFSVFNRPRALAGDPRGPRAITLPYRDSVFSLEFAALHFADPQDNRYRYQLEGFDQGWVETDAARRFATYTNLDPGHYVFRVRASNKDGVWSEVPATLDITITPPLWKTWWFRALALLAALSAAYCGYRLRVRALVQQKGRLERDVGLRTAELRLQKEEAERQREVADDAYRQLKATQAQLAAREKLASLGSLVAGVAHELNTPIGNSLLMASTLHDRTEKMAERFDGATLRKSDLADWIAASQEASGLIMRSLHNAAELVSSFKQVSVDQASAQRRRFDLAQACHEIAATMMNKVRHAGHALELAVPEGIVLDSFPGPLGQVLINFVDNALLHAFEAPGGTMRLSATQPEPGRVRIEFSDNGRGIAPAHLARIFDPFFTTRMGQGGSGLGLNIAYNIVTSLLGGTIHADSQPGRGTTFTLDLPLVAAQAGATDPTHEDHA